MGVEERRLGKGERNGAGGNFGGNEMFTIIILIISGVYTYVKIYEIIHFNCLLHINYISVKAVKN